MRRPFQLIAGLALLASPVAAAAQQPAAASPAKPLTFGSEVELVTVDAVVVDKKGAPVMGLRREDFTLAEEGVMQPVASFEAVEPAAPTAGPPRRAPVISTNVGTDPRTARVFAVVFDDMHMTPLQAHRGKLAAAEFLTNGVREGDRVLLVPSSGGAWWSGRMESGRSQLMAVLRRLEGRIVDNMTTQDRIADYEAMAIVARQDQQIARVVTQRFESAGLTAKLKQESDDQLVATPVNRYVDTRAREAYDLALVRDRQTLDGLKRLLDALAAARGRKSVILISQGFIFNPALTEFRDVVNAARQANTAIYFVDTRGLESSSSPFKAEFGNAIFASDVQLMYTDVNLACEGSELLASETGGFSVRRSGDLAAGIQRIANESRGYYLLGYAPSASEQDGRFRRITVRVNRRGVTVRARRGYFAASPGLARVKPRAEDELEPDLQQALDAPLDRDAIPLRMTAYAFGETLINRAKVFVAADIDIRAMAFLRQEGRLADTLDALLLVSHLESGEVYQYSERVEMRLRPQTLTKTPWYSLLREFDLEPGSYQARLVLRDRNDKKIGSLMHAFDLPSLGTFRVSTPVLSDTVAASADGADTPAPVPLARRTFYARGPLYCQFEVYNAARDHEGGKPQVLCGHKLVSADGLVRREAEPTPIAVSPKGIVSRQIAMSMDGMEPGEYELVMSIADTIAGKTIEVREPFTLESAKAAPDAK